MEKIYKVVFVYPDGHIEEIEEAFNEGRDALEYDNNLLNQVLHTEQYKNPFEEDKHDPYFMIVEVNGKKFKMVFESKH